MSVVRPRSPRPIRSRGASASLRSAVSKCLSPSVFRAPYVWGCAPPRLRQGFSIACSQEGCECPTLSVLSRSILSASACASAALRAELSPSSQAPTVLWGVGKPPASLGGRAVAVTQAFERSALLPTGTGGRQKPLPRGPVGDKDQEVPGPPWDGVRKTGFEGLVPKQTVGKPQTGRDGSSPLGEEASRPTGRTDQGLGLPHNPHESWQSPPEGRLTPVQVPC